MKFRIDGYNCAFDFVYIDGGRRERDTQLEQEFEAMLSDVVDSLGLKYISHVEAYRISEEQEQYLRGAAAGFCFAMNRRLSSGYCSASLHIC